MRAKIPDAPTMQKNRKTLAAAKTATNRASLTGSVRIADSTPEN